MGKYDKFGWYWLPAILWAGLIFYLSGVAGLSSGLPIFWDVFWRKLAHATEFGVLDWLIFRAWRGYGIKIGAAIFWSFVLAAFYALTDEWHQSFVPRREGRWQDVGVDCLGVLAMTVVIFLVNRMKIFDRLKTPFATN